MRDYYFPRECVHVCLVRAIRIGLGRYRDIFKSFFPISDTFLVREGGKKSLCTILDIWVVCNCTKSRTRICEENNRTC